MSSPRLSLALLDRRRHRIGSRRDAIEVIVERWIVEHFSDRTLAAPHLADDVIELVREHAEILGHIGAALDDLLDIGGPVRPRSRRWWGAPSAEAARDGDVAVAEEPLRHEARLGIRPDVFWYLFPTRRTSVML